ncbi:sulfate/thiosulfate ABC transporter ATP-binding protein CysA [Candidatus Profftia tarda]|uniref:Sulfate/thiosulfate import ATP-binding protein CysA n=1 Tax=Candidatus Profftia tarda TaxID=1177216 RepID=A0A8E4EYF7_9ENTR|nr:sulfate/thiosulfate ABC transporter ATP-binding protein CysA [Candidatus Profftia tarda]CAD6510556.1 Sulfate/thiosulfate import ATP-binding protein CysA [Candidatus Profftia tarda]
MSIEVKNVSKYFNKTKVLNDISLTIPSGHMVALLGPSGSGKTTLLRIIAGLEVQSSGHLRFNGNDVSHLHARDRRVGFVFQHYALFRHMSVFDNVAFGLTVLHGRMRPCSSLIKNTVGELLERVQLSHLSDRFPAQLSGGQKQRVALARALAVEPAILLLDEPFGALDARVRKELRRWLRQLHEDLGFTSVFVTHDQEEAMEVADQIVVMSQGNIEQIGTPDAVWSAPNSRFVLEFLGEVNKVSGEIRGSNIYISKYHWPLDSPSVYQGKVDIFLRPWDIEVISEASIRCPLPVQVLEASPRGYYQQITAQPEGWDLEPISLVIPSVNLINIPHRGERYFVGWLSARLYDGDTFLRTVEFAKIS